LCFLFAIVVASKQKKAATRPQSILDGVPTKAFSAPPFKPAGRTVFKAVTNAALKPTSNDVLKHVGNAGQLGDKEILPFGSATLAFKALVAALDSLDTNMSDTPTPLPPGDNVVQPQDLGCNPPSLPSAIPTTSSMALSIGRVPFMA
jgi:hypothetical protein